MNKTLLAVIGSVIVVGFLYMHFEWVPAHSGPDRADAQAALGQWARDVSGQETPDVRVARVNIPDGAGVAAVEVAFHQLYYELDGTGNYYSGRARADFQRVGGIFRPGWTLSKITLLDREPNVLLASNRSTGD